MGITDYFSDLLSSASAAMPSFTTEAFAEAPKEDDDNEQEGGDDDEGKEDGGEEGEEEEDGGEDEEEEEEEEEEPVDPKPELEEKCARSSKCAPYKHHFDECVERVHKASEDPDHKGPKEDCVEEFFHLQHCATQCAAPELFKILK